MKKIFIALCMPLSAHALFTYDRAIHQAQKGNWQESSNLLKNSLIQNPDRADMLYDLGVSTYKNAEHDKALAYFNQAAQIATTQSLKEQALFNAGNAQVQLKQLHEAIASYDKVLSLNPEHVKAKHNKEVVQKMLEQQKKEEEKKDQQKDKNESQDKKENKEENKNNQQDEQKKQDPKDPNQQNSKDDQQNKKQNDQQDPNDRNKKSQQEEKKKEEQQPQPEQKKQKENPEPGAQQPSSSSQEQQKSQGQNEQKLTPSLARILKEHEKKDADLNKKMIKAMAGTQKGSSHGNNSW